MTIGGSAGSRGIEMLGSFESTFLPRHDVDVSETNGHSTRWREDLALLRSIGIRRLRYPVRWHRVEAEYGVFDWSATDEVLGHMRQSGHAPIVDLVHHTSYPRWLRGGFLDPRFGDAFLRYVQEFAQRYDWVEEYTLFNEPFSTLLLSGCEGVWPPYGKGLRCFIQMLQNVLPAIADGSRLLREILPRARHVYVDSCEQHTGEGVGAEYARYANDRRFFVLDALLGRCGESASRPFVKDLIAHGGRPLLRLEPITIDTLGLDYYAHCQWHFGDRGEAPTPHPAPLSDVIQTYAERYGVPCMLSETNLRGFPSDRATWLKYTLEQCEAAIAKGVQLEGYCWFPSVDSCDWDSLLFRADGNVDPVGVFSIDNARERHGSSMSAAYAAAASGAPSSQLTAYRLREPVKTWLRGYAPQLSHWAWSDAPSDESIANGIPGDRQYEPLQVREIA
jgi:beta-glucosidase